MIASERRLHIMRQLNASGVIDLKTVAQTLDISEATVRRDFEKLEQEGKLTRVQGGAMLTTGVDERMESVQPSMHAKKHLQRDEKRMVAEYAAALVQDGESVFLDCGTSLAPLGEILLKRDVYIVSNNMLLLNYSPPSTNLFLLGGQYKRQYDLVYGPLTKRTVGEFRFDHAFIGCFGFSLEQQRAFTLEVDSAEIKQAAMENAAHSHLLADSSKIERRGFYGFAALSRFDGILCERAGKVEVLRPAAE